MCPACFANAAALLLATASTGGIATVITGKLRHKDVPSKEGENES